MKRYLRVMLGAKSKYQAECHAGNFIGADFGIEGNLTQKLHEDWKEFNKELIPIWQKKNPGKSKVSAGLSCGALWTICKGIQLGDIVICPNGEGSYYVGEVIENYTYVPGGILPHRRKVRWYSNLIDRSQMSDQLKNSTGSIGTVSDVTKYAEEIERILGGTKPQVLISMDETIVDTSEFAMEKHLEDFLVENWRQTELGKKYDIYEEDGEIVGKQYPTDTGPVDILAISKDKKELLVVELKKGRVSDSVVGQIQRYMGYVLEELAEDNQTVKGENRA